MQTGGATVAFKEPGCSVNHPNTIVDASAKTFLLDDDLFIFGMERIHGRLLKRYGKVVSTDATHAVFSYGNIKLIVVMVTSFSSNIVVRERGFPVAFALTTSEREDVHKAIVAHLRAAVPDWEPELLMSDMAFAAYNAWKAFFPNLRWLWCVFHVWQAWIRRLKQLQRPDGVERDDWSRLKGSLIKAIKELISPKQEHSFTPEHFEKTCDLIVRLMWLHGLDETADCFEGYVKNASRWAPFERRAAVLEVFGSWKRMPMLAMSNNPLEAFFGVVKYTLLDGKSGRTVVAFLEIWRLYEGRLFSNMTKCHFVDDLDMGDTLLPNPDTDAINPFEVEEEGEGAAGEDGFEERLHESVEDAEVDDESGSQQATDGGLMDFEASRALLDRKTLEKERELLVMEIKTAVGIAGKLLEDGFEDAKVIRGFRQSLSTASLLGNAVLDPYTSTVSTLPRSSSEVPFFRQSLNFGSATPQALIEHPSSSAVEQGTAPESSGADYALLQKSKRRK
jgi:MULE transposase domain